MSRFLDAIKVLTGRASLTEEPGALYGSPAVESAGGLIAGVVPYGVPPIRGSRELMISQKRDPWMHAVTRKIASSFASVPWSIVSAKDAAGRPSAKGAREYRRVRGAIERQERPELRKRRITEARRDLRVDPIDDHPLMELLDTANPAMTGHAASEITQIFLDLEGEAFWILERNAAGIPVEFWPIPPYWVYRTPYTNEPFFHVIYGTYTAKIPETDVVWFKHLDPENPYARGAGTGRALGDEIDTDEYAAKTVKAHFYNHAIPPFVVGMEGASADTVKVAKENWERNNRGFFNAMRGHWTNAKITIAQLATKFVDQQLVELRRSLRDTKVNTYGVPPEILGIIENSNRSTIEAARFIYAEEVMLPRLQFRRSMLQVRLVPEFDEGIVMEFESPTPNDNEFTLNVGKSAPWSWTVDEWRDLAGRDPLGGADGAERPPMPASAAGGFGAPPIAAPKAAPVIELVTKATPEQEAEALVELLDPDRLTSELAPVMRQRVMDWAEDALVEVGSEVSFDLLNPIVERHLRAVATERIAGLVDGTTRDELRAALVEGFKAGEDSDAIAARVREVFLRADRVRAKAIARTEVQRSANFASTAAYKLSGLVKQREWVATKDDRTRDSHLELDGQVASIDEPFTTKGGDSAMYPGDFGIADEDIQCRCTTAPLIEDVAGATVTTKAADRIAVWKRHDRKLVPWEKAAEAALRRGFKAQRADIIKKLTRR